MFSFLFIILIIVVGGGGGRGGAAAVVAAVAAAAAGNCAGAVAVAVVARCRCRRRRCCWCILYIVIMLLCYYVIMLLLCYYVIVLLCYYVIHNRCIFPFNSFAPSDSHRKKHLLIIPGAERSESRNTTLSQPGLQANRHTRLRPMPGINDLRNFAKSAKWKERIRVYNFRSWKSPQCELWFLTWGI